MFALLRRRDFALLWLGGLISIAGDWVLHAALPFFVYEQTGSTLATAGMIVAQLTPSVLLGSFAGVFVDRWDRKRILVVSNLLQAGAVALLLLVPGEGWIWVVYVVAGMQSAVAAFAGPAETALLRSLVGDADLVAANALNALNNRLGRLVGAPAGGALLGALGLEAVVVADCATFVAAAALIAPITDPRRARTAVEEAVEELRSRASFWAEWRAGLSLVRNDRSIAILFVVFGLMTFGGTMLDPLHAAWVRDVLGEGPEVYGLLLTTSAASGMLGTLVVGRYGSRVGAHSLIGWNSIVAGIALFVKFNVPFVPVAVSTSAVSGVTSVASSVGVETLAMRTVHEEFRGRVFGLLQATIFLLSLLGALTGGVLAEAVGIVTMLNVAAALVVIAGVVVLRAFRPARGLEEAPVRT